MKNSFVLGTVELSLEFEIANGEIASKAQTNRVGIVNFGSNSLHPVCHGLGNGFMPFGQWGYTCCGSAYPEGLSGGLSGMAYPGAYPERYPEAYPEAYPEGLSGGLSGG